MLEVEEQGTVGLNNRSHRVLFMDSRLKRGNIYFELLFG
jgi:hypothetical protein